MPLGLERLGLLSWLKSILFLLLFVCGTCVCIHVHMHALCGRECRHACATVCVAVRGQPQVSGPSVHLVFETRSLCCFFCALQLASLGTLLSPNSHFPMGTLGFTEACTSMPGLLRGLQLVELSSSSLHASAPPLSYLPTAALQTFAIVLFFKKNVFLF